MSVVVSHSHGIIGWSVICDYGIFGHTLSSFKKICFSSSAQPYEFFAPFVFEQKSIQFANLEDGINRIQHYSKALSKDAVKRYIPQFQEVVTLSICF